MTRTVGALVVLSAATLVAGAQSPPRDTSFSPPGAAVIRGRVLAADSGDPIRNARVGMADSGMPPALTDADGRFRLAPVRPGRIVVTATKAGYAATTFGAGDDGRAGALDVAPSAVLDGIDIRLPKGAAIVGRVVDDLGEPMPSITVAAERLLRVGDRIEFVRAASVETDDLGEYRLFGLSAGQYVARVAAPAPAPGGPPVPVQPFTLAIAQRLSTGPVAWTGGFYPDVATLAKGQGISVNAGDEVPGITLTTLPLSPVDRNASGIIVDRRVPGASFTSPTPAPSRPGTIRGRVVRTDGLPVGRTRVRLTSSERLFTPYAMPTDDDGYYEFPDLAPGAYLLTATKFGYLQKAYGQRGTIDRGDLVTVGRGQTVDHIDITLPRGGVIAGRIVDENADPIENAAVIVGQIRVVGGRRRIVNITGSARRTNDLGRYRVFGLPPGQYLVSASASQNSPASAAADLSGYARTYAPGTPSPNEAETVEVRTTEDALNVDFALVKGRFARVTGRVLGAAGEPYQGVVAMTSSYRSGAIAVGSFEVRSGVGGRFAFPAVPPGEYVMQAARSRTSKSIEGESGVLFVTVNVDDADVDLPLSAGSAVTGQITFEGGAAPPDAEDLEVAPVPVDPDLASLVGNPTARAEVHEDWTFEIGGLNGPRRLRIAHAPDGWMLKRILLGGADVTDTPLAFGRKEQSLSDVEIVMTNRVTQIAGVVTDARGRGVADTAVVTFAFDQALRYANSRFVAHADAGSDARFAIPALPPGEYYVAAVDKRQVTDISGEVENPSFLASLVAGATRVTLTEGEARSVSVKVIDR